MTSRDTLAAALRSLQTDADYSEAVLELQDGTRLCFCHRVGERWAKAVGPESQPNQGGSAEAILAGIAMFRLNAKHLDVQFVDGSRWESRFR